MRRAGVKLAKGRAGTWLLALSLVAGCRPERGAPDGPLRFWALGREGEIVAQLVPEFERLHPDVAVRVQQVPWSAAREKLLTAYVGGAMPDVLQVGNTWVPELVALGALEPLDRRVDAAAASDFFAGALDTNRIDGALYGLPWYVDTRLLFYRKDLLARAGIAAPPTSWADWREAMRRVRSASGESAILLPFDEWQPLVILAMQRGARLLRDRDTRGDFRSPAFAAAFAFYLDLFREGLALTGGGARSVHLYQDFGAGYFTFFVSGPWNLGELERRLPEALQSAWATAPMPAPDGDAPGVSTAGGASLVIHRGSARREDAWKWVAFLTERASQIALWERTGDLPSRLSAWQEPRLARDPRARAFRRQLERVRATPKIPEWERIADEIGRHAEAAIRGELPPERALADLDAAVDEILSKRRWLLARSDSKGAVAVSGRPPESR
jgi:multiple sugar transport system substrate-binding protein